MPRRNIDGLDLNLLRALDAVLRHRSVSGAAQSLGTGQPTVSKQLAKLRVWLDDPLFARRGNDWAPTERAVALGTEVRAFLDRLEASMQPAATRTFDPAVPREVRLLTADYAQLVLVPTLLERIASTRLTLSIHPWRLGYVDALSSEEVELVIAPAATAAASTIRRRRLLEDRFVLLARRDHPRLRAQPTIDAMLACEHVQVAPDGRSGSLVDDALEEQGLTRFVRLRVPGFAGLPTVLVESDRVAVVPARVAEVLGRAHALQVLPLPLTVSSFAIDMYWHVHRDGDAGLRFVRKQLAECVRRERSAKGDATTLHDVRRRRRATL